RRQSVAGRNRGRHRPLSALGCGVVGVGGGRGWLLKSRDWTVAPTSGGASAEERLSSRDLPAVTKGGSWTVAPTSGGAATEERLFSRDLSGWRRVATGQSLLQAGAHRRRSGCLAAIFRADEESRLDSRSYKRGRIDVGAAVQPRSSGLAKSRDWTVAPTSGGAAT